MKNTTSRPRKGPLRNHDKEQFWRTMLQGKAQSGLNARAFCLFRGLSEPSFYAWRRTLGERDRPARVSRRESTPTPTPRSQQPMFLELRPSSPSSSSSSSSSSPAPPCSGSGAADVPLELLLGDRRLLIRSGCDLALRRDVLAALDSDLGGPGRAVNPIGTEKGSGAYMSSSAGTSNKK